MKEIELTKTLTLIEDETDGLSIKSSKTGLSYDLLTGMSTHGKTSSDLIFVMVATPDIGYVGMLNYRFGASMIAFELEDLAKDIEDFENGTGYWKLSDYNRCVPLDEFNAIYHITTITNFYALTDEQIKLARKVLYGVE